MPVKSMFMLQPCTTSEFFDSELLLLLTNNHQGRGNPGTYGISF